MALTKVTNNMVSGASANILDYGADPTAVIDSTAAIQAAIDYVESKTRNGGVVFVPKGAYRCSAKIRVGGWVSLRGEGRFSSSLFWDSSYTSGNCIELGPDESGTFGYSGSYTFGTRIESLDLNASNIYRGANNAVVYTVGAHQFSGLYDVSVRNFTSYGVHNDLATGGQACFILSNVEIQGGTTAPTLGNKYGLVCSGSGAFIKADSMTIQGTTAHKVEQGIRMLKDHLVLSGCHFEYCDVGILLAQNESTIRHNSIIGVTGHSSVPDLILAGLTTNLEYNLSSISSLTTDGAISLNVLRDLKSGVTVGGLGGLAMGSYSNTARKGGNNLPFAWANYNAGTSSLGQSYNITSVSTSTTGVFVFTLSSALKDVTACPIPSVKYSAGALGTSVATVLSTTTIEVRTYNSAGSLATPDSIYLTLFSVDN